MEQQNNDDNNDGNIDSNTMEQEDNETPNENYNELISLINEKKGPIPKDIGVSHRLMRMTWMPKNIEKIHDKQDNDLLYFFYSECVSRVVGKRKWNKYSQVRKMGNFVTTSDEAFAMIILENNLPKWMDELRHNGRLARNEKRKSLYTQEDKSKGWSNKGQKRFIELCRICEDRRKGTEEKKLRWNQIEKIVMDREILWNDMSNRKRKRVEEENISEVTTEDNTSDEEADIENFMLSMACGNGTTRYDSEERNEEIND